MQSKNLRSGNKQVSDPEEETGRWRCHHLWEKKAALYGPGIPQASVQSSKMVIMDLKMPCDKARQVPQSERVYPAQTAWDRAVGYESPILPGFPIFHEK